MKLRGSLTIFDDLELCNKNDITITGIISARRYFAAKCGKLILRKLELFSNFHGFD
jgi:hypothetical protein